MTPPSAPPLAMAPRSAPPLAAALSSAPPVAVVPPLASPAAAMPPLAPPHFSCSLGACFSTTFNSAFSAIFSVAAPPSAPRPVAAPHSLQRHRHCSAYRGRRDTASRLIPAAVHRICSRCALRSSLGRSVLCRRSDLSCRRVVCKCQFASTPSRRGGAVIQSRGRSNRSRDRDRRRPTQAPCRRGGQ